MSAVVQSKTVAASGVSPTTSLAFTSNVTAGTMLYMLTPISNGTTPIVCVRA